MHTFYDRKDLFAPHRLTDLCSFQALVLRFGKGWSLRQQQKAKDEEKSPELSAESYLSRLKGLGITMMMIMMEPLDR